MELLCCIFTSNQQVHFISCDKCDIIHHLCVWFSLNNVVNLGKNGKNCSFFGRILDCLINIVKTFFNTFCQKWLPPR